NTEDILPCIVMHCSNLLFQTVSVPNVSDKTKGRSPPMGNALVSLLLYRLCPGMSNISSVTIHCCYPFRCLCHTPGRGTAASCLRAGSIPLPFIGIRAQYNPHQPCDAVPQLSFGERPVCQRTADILMIA